MFLYKNDYIISALIIAMLLMYKIYFTCKFDTFPSIVYYIIIIILCFWFIGTRCTIVVGIILGFKQLLERLG